MKYVKEKQEALLRSQTMLMVNRNHDKHYIVRRIIKRFLGCISH